MNNPSGMSPIYIGIDRKTPGPLKFQFKGDNSLYGCKLPVEGAVFSKKIRTPYKSYRSRRSTK